MNRLIDVLVNNSTKQGQEQPQTTPSSSSSSQKIDQEQQTEAVESPVVEEVRESEKLEIESSASKVEKQAATTTTTTTTTVASAELLKTDLGELKKRLDETRSSFMSSKHDLDELLGKFVKAEPERRAKFYSNIIECIQHGRSTLVDEQTSSETPIDNVDRFYNFSSGFFRFHFDNL